MNKIFFIIVLVIILFPSCKKDNSNIDVDNASQYYITGETNLPATTTSRMVYYDTAFNVSGIFGTGGVSSEWVNGETIEFCFVQNGTMVRTTTTVTPISGNHAKYSVAIPSGITPTTGFRVYAVNGGRPNGGGGAPTAYTTAAAPNIVNLKINVNSKKNDFTDQTLMNSIIQVARPDTVIGNPQGNYVVPLNFYNIGSLIAFSFKNVSGRKYDVQTLAINSANNWVYSATSKYDLTTGKMTSTSTTTKALSFFNNTTNGGANTIPIGGYLTIYQWFIPVENTAANGLTITMTGIDKDFFPRTVTTASDGVITDRGILSTGNRYKINRNFNNSSNNLDFVIQKSQ